MRPMAESWLSLCLISPEAKVIRWSMRVPSYSSEEAIRAAQKEGMWEMIKLLALKSSVSLASGISLGGE
jgi:hypothetical protein